MAGISSNALKGVNYPENRKKYNGIEFTKELDLNAYDAFYRTLDPQIGRWWQVDPKSERTYSESPFVSMGNNPISNKDPLGDLFFGLFGSTAEQRRAAREVARETGGEVVSTLSRNIHVNYTTTEKTYDEKAGIVNTAVGHTVNFRKDGRVETGTIMGNRALDQQTAFWSNHRVDRNGNVQFLPASGRADYVAVESLAVPLPPVLGILGRTLQGSKSTTLFRAVSEAELNDIAVNGLRVNPVTGYETSKLFATTAADAASFGRNNYAFDGITNTIIEVRVPAQTMRFAEKKVLDGYNAVSVPSNMLNTIKTVKPLNFSPNVSGGFGPH
jgi:RHS repeat-associated protein